ncbi:MAG: TetR/AcrR family transcriptional regulator [bacterium]|nr:TetR/AcrR family transcriptional regulator [bacterium]
MSPKSSEQFEQQRLAAKEKILNSALELFADKGFHATKMADIAKKAGVATGLSYHYFKNKDDILKEIIEKSREMHQHLPDLQNPDFLDRFTIHEAVAAFFNMLESNDNFMRLFLSLIHQPNVFDSSAALHNIFGGLREIMTAFLKKSNVKDPESEAMLFSSLLSGLAFNYLLDKNSFNIEVIKKLIIERYETICKQGS